MEEMRALEPGPVGKLAAHDAQFSLMSATVAEVQETSNELTLSSITPSGSRR